MPGCVTLEFQVVANTWYQLQRVEEQLKDMKQASAESMLECLRHLQSLNEDVA